MLNIERFHFWAGKQLPHYFHPAVCRAANDWVMTMQQFNGAGDTYGPVEYAVSNDEGVSWSEPQPLPAMQSTWLTDDIQEGVADVRTFYHAPTRTVIALGCTTYYSRTKSLLENPDFDRQKYSTRPVYAVRNTAGEWSERQYLNHPAFSECVDWRTACTQIEFLADGTMIIPIYYAPTPTAGPVASATLHCSFDGRIITIEAAGPRVPTGRCPSYLIEPSVVRCDNRFLLTLRTGEERAYLACSEDGLNWQTPAIWRWDDRTPLITVNTQQHWLTIAGKLFLVYTRKSSDNQDVMRWRAPLFAAEVDPERLCLKRATEQVILPLIRKDSLPYISGNYHVTAVNNELAVVSDGQLWYRVAKGRTPAEDYIADYESFVAIAKIRR